MQIDEIKEVMIMRKYTPKYSGLHLSVYEEQNDSLVTSPQEE